LRQIFEEDQVFRKNLAGKDLEGVMRLPLRIAVLAGVTLGHASIAQAYSVTIDLGLSAQDYVLYGQGAYSPGLGSFTNQQGSETYNPGTNTTTDTLSGSITGSTDPGLASGSYEFVTTYLGTPIGAGGTQIQSESNPSNPNFFFYSFLAPSVDMTVYLTGTPVGSYTIPLVTNGAFDGPGFNFFTPSDTCSGLTTLPCSQNNVGLTPGSSYSGAAEITLTTTIVPEPSTWAMMLLGFAGLGFVGYRASRRNVSVA
jgi:hypothetical protein